MARSRLPLTVFGDDLEELADLGSGEAAWCAGTRLGALDGVAGIGLEDIHANEELEEGGDTGETGADGYGRRLTAREADASERTLKTS